MRHEDRAVYEALGGALERVARVLERMDAREDVAGRQRAQAARETQAWRRPDRPYDVVGRQEPRTLPVTTFLAAVPGLAAQFGKEVPAGYIAEASLCATRERVLVVDCTCGGDAMLGGGVQSCQGACGRYFLPIGEGRVMVAGPFSDDVAESAQAAA